MKLAYLTDTHFGYFDQPIPDAPEVAEASQRLIREAEVAEEVGFDGVFVNERHARTETYFPSPVVLAAAIAARTTRVQIASTVIQPTYYNPVHLAEQLMCIDQISKGRLIFGAGVGYHDDYFRLFGVPKENIGDRFEETLEVIDGVWTQERYSFSGEFFEFDDVLLTPKPYQDPRPPIWIGAFYDKAIQRALDWDGWIWWFPMELDEAYEKVQPWREKALERGKEDWTFGLAYKGWCGRDEKKVKERHGHRFIAEADFYEDKALTPDMKKDALQRLEDQYLILGPPQKWVDRLGAMKEKLDPDWVCLACRNANSAAGAHYPDEQESLDNIRMLGEEVIRHFQK